MSSTESVLHERRMKLGLWVAAWLDQAIVVGWDRLRYGLPRAVSFTNVDGMHATTSYGLSRASLHVEPNPVVARVDSHNRFIFFLVTSY